MQQQQQHDAGHYRDCAHRLCLANTQCQLMLLLVNAPENVMLLPLQDQVKDVTQQMQNSTESVRINYALPIPSVGSHDVVAGTALVNVVLQDLEQQLEDVTQQTQNSTESVCMNGALPIHSVSSCW